jgi:hypothetical protein
MEANVVGMSNTNAYKKMENPIGNQAEPFNFLTTF